MNNRYLFKAIDTNSVWRTGLLIALKGDRCTIEESDGSKWACDAKTLCQCTGLKDKNGKLIWENDILHNGNYFVVKWNESCSRFDIVLNKFCNIPIGKWEPMICDWKTNDFKEYRKAVDYEVIGNVFDNPKLLGIEVDEEIER
jgi:uncharacterized phage protein (TIGR01671 family)